MRRGDSSEKLPRNTLNPCLHKMGESVLLASIMGAQAVLLGIVSRLRFRIFPDPETGKCICLSGCSEVPLTDSHEAVDCHEHEVGQGQKILVVSAKT